MVVSAIKKIHRAAICLLFASRVKRKRRSRLNYLRMEYKMLNELISQEISCMLWFHMIFESENKKILSVDLVLRLNKELID